MATFWNKIFKKKSNDTYNWDNILSGIIPAYSDGFGNDIYASDVVQQALYSIVTEMKKLDMTHIQQNGSDVVPVYDSIQRCLNNPNPLMTSSDYIEKITWNLLLNYNSFIYPLWEGNNLVGLYPLQPSNVEFFQNDVTGEYTVNFTFPNGYEGEIPYSNIIHMRYRYSVSDFMGGDEQGHPNFKPVLDTLKINDTMLKGLAKTLNIQTAINGIVKIKTMANTDSQMERIREFEQKLTDNKSGILPIDVASEYTPISKQVQLLDETVLRFLDEKVLRMWGVPLSIVKGDYTKEQYEAFYQKTLEPLVKNFAEAHTKGIFSSKAANGYGNKIMFYPKDLVFMSMSQKLEMINILSPTGTMFENEKRVALGIKPSPELVGKRMMSLNWVDAKDASKYQTGENNNDEGVNNDE